MSKKKIYKSTTGIQYGFVVPIKRVGKIINISVALGNDLTLEVLFPDIQEAIEKTKYFKNGQIKIEREMELSEADKIKLESTKQVEAEKLKAIEEAKILSKIEEDKKNEELEASVTSSATDKGANDPEKTDVDGTGDNDEGKSADTVNNEATPYNDVTDINGAVAILKGEPYKVHHMKLQNPTAILEQAKLNNISFPNWNPQ